MDSATAHIPGFRAALGRIEAEAAAAERERIAPLIVAVREVVRFYGTDRTWSLMYRTLLGSRIDDLSEALEDSDD